MSQNEDTKTKNLTNQLTTLNAQILQAEEAGLPDQIAPHLHENFTIIRASGKKENRQAFLDAVPANANRGRSADQLEIHPYGDCAVVIICVTTSQNKDGAPAVGRFWNTRVFIRQSGQWRCVAWQVTEIRQP